MVQKKRKRKKEKKINIFVIRTKFKKKMCFAFLCFYYFLYFKSKRIRSITNIKNIQMVRKPFFLRITQYREILLVSYAKLPSLSNFLLFYGNL